MIKTWRMRRLRHVVHVGKIRHACKILVGKPEGKRPLRRTREDNIKADFREIGLEDVDRFI
jgi:hypothetical protein